MIVTGPTLRSATGPEHTMTAPSEWSIHALRRTGWRGLGEAGSPLGTADPQAANRGEELEVRRQRLARERAAAERAYRQFQLDHQKRGR